MNVNLKNKGKWFKLIFLVFVITTALSIILFILTMAFYPGGNLLNTSQDGYSLIYNAICDLSFKTALNGESNILSRNLLIVTTFVQFLGATLFFSVFWIFFQKRKATKYLSIIGSVFAIVIGPLNFIIILVHRTNKFHMTIITITPLLLVLAVIFYTIIFFMTEDIPKISLYSFLSLATLSVVYSVIIGSASAFGGLFEYIAHRLGNSLLNYIVAVAYILQGIGAIIYINFLMKD